MRYFSLLDRQNRDHLLCYKSLQFFSTWNETMLTLPSSEHSTVVLRNFKFLSVLFCVISFWKQSRLFVFASSTRLMTLWREI